MDTAVGLVQAYLHVNGYFTVTEYPVLEAREHGSYRSATDIDVVALRLPRAGGLVAAGSRERDGFAADPALGGAADQAQLLLAEVKEGAAELNQGARDPKVLAAVLHRFVSCPEAAVPHAIRALLQRGEARIPSAGGLEARLVAFGATLPPHPGSYRTVSLTHVIDFLHAHLSRHWDMLRHAQVKDQTFAFLMMLEKARRGGKERTTGGQRG